MSPAPGVVLVAKIVVRHSAYDSSSGTPPGTPFRCSGTTRSWQAPQSFYWLSGAFESSRPVPAEKWAGLFTGFAMPPRIVWSSASASAAL